MPKQATDQVPSPAVLADAFRKLMTRGLPATLPDHIPLFLELHAVRARAAVDTDSSRLAGLHALIRELIADTRSDLFRHLAPYAFGTFATEDLPLRTRLERASTDPWIALGYEALRREPLNQLARNFADRLYILERRYRANDWLERPDVYNEIHDETLRQYDFYTAMAFWIDSAANDLDAAIAALREEDDDEFVSFAQAALWRWAKFLNYNARHDELFAGLWSFRTDADLREVLSIAADIDRIPWIDTRDRSWLRIQLCGAQLEELDPFLAALEREARGRQIIERWEDWLRSCPCQAEEPNPEGCAVHHVIAAARRFYEIMRTEISEPYRTDRVARFLTLPDLYEP